MYSARKDEGLEGFCHILIHVSLENTQGAAANVDELDQEVNHFSARALSTLYIAKPDLRLLDTPLSSKQGCSCRTNRD